MRYAAFNTGLDFHLLDHIVPLAELLSMPLIVTEELNHSLASRYYPQVPLRYMPDLEFQLGSIGEEFDTLFECKYWQPHLKSLFQTLYHKEIELIFCPHGQSDKGYQTPLLAPYATHDAILLYGPLQIEMLKELNIWPSLDRYAVLGNYRYQFYQKYRSFYDRIAEKEIFSKLNSQNRTVLYAPTWRDADQATSFFHHGTKVLSELPQEWNLIIKLHPLLEQRDPSHFYAITKLAEKKSNVILIHEFPPVYPLLSKADIYLGDSSSVGYDFLKFERPLYFFPTKNLGRLHHCGTIIDPTKNLYKQFEIKNSDAEKQRELYQFAFGKQNFTSLSWERAQNKNS